MEGRKTFSISPYPQLQSLGPVTWVASGLQREQSIKEVVTHTGKFIKIDEEMKIDGVILDKYSRVRMDIEVDKPLLRGRFIRSRGKRYWI
ncbi:hypothetical protein Scep_012578 [Stephania cephalantha]|uniref:Uncharacterized protein n=1 Tax=Stephania cephalantha TaxID=152367 RepID=A0AAP0JHD5_9MAGN